MTDLPLLYHIHHSLEAEDIAFWKTLARRFGSPVLELGCGTGRVLRPLAEASRHVVGLDRDLQMLFFLQESLSSVEKARVRLLCADFRRFGVGMRFPLIVMPCNTFSPLDRRGQVQTLQGVRRHLLPEGVFVVSQPNPHLLASLPENSSPEVEITFPHPRTGNPVQVLSEWTRSGDGVVFRWHYDHLLPDGQVQRQTLTTRHALQSPEMLLVAFERAGLSVQALYGDYAQNDFRDDSPWLIVMAGNSRD